MTVLSNVKIVIMLALKYYVSRIQLDQRETWNLVQKKTTEVKLNLLQKEPQYTQVDPD